MKKDIQGYEIPNNNLSDTDIAKSLTNFLQKGERDNDFEIALAITLKTLSKVIENSDTPNALKESWKLIYRQKPPFSMSEFLTPTWIGGMA